MKYLCTGIWMWALLAGSVFALEIRARPEKPTLDDVVEIEIHGCTQGGVLHWGVNAVGHNWEEPIPPYRPRFSTMDGRAVRTPLTGPDENGVCRVTLGPFNNKEQPVRAVNFAIRWQDGQWSNNEGLDYSVQISFGRITISPQRPTLNDQIVVTIRRSAPGGQLRWGVNAVNELWQPPHTNYWPRRTIPSDDGLAVDSPISRPDSQGNSTIVLGPFDRAEQVVTSLHMAVHWGNVWDTDAGRNYNTDISLDSGPVAPFVRFHAPTNDEALVDALSVELETKRADHVELRLNGKPVTKDGEAPYELSVPFEKLSFGRHELTARAVNSNGVGMQQITFWKVPPYKVETLPPGTAWGPTVHDDGTVTFTLHAPGKRFVSLIGSFNQTNALSDIMNFSPDGTWWIRRPLEPGVHRYQFSIDGRMRLADPYARDIHWKDARGRETYQPSNAWAVLAVGQTSYTWRATEYQRPPLENLVVYEFHIDDLCPGQGFTGVISKLDYIKDLGVTAIGPLPFTEFPSASSWGYNPAFHMAPESAYGTPDELKRLIDEAHLRGLAVIFDMVLNHMDRGSALYQLYGRDYDASPYFRLYTGENWGFPDLEQRSKAFKRYAADAIRHWIEEYRMDGFRYDATRFVEWHGYNDWGASWFAWSAKQVDPQNFQIAEHMPSDPEFINATEMDTTWHEQFRWRLREMIERAHVDREEFERIMIPQRLGYTNAFQRMAYTESHDEERTVYELERARFGRREVLRRAATALAITLTAPGTTMIYAGQEFGEDTRKVVGHNPLQWKKLRQPGARELYQSARALTRLRTQHPALRTENIAIQSGNLPDNTLAYTRSAGDSHVVVAANLGRGTQTLAVHMPREGTWSNVLNGATIEVDRTLETQLSLEAGGAAVLAVRD